MTARRLTGRHPAIRQFLTMSPYRGMDLLLTWVSTQAAQDFVDDMDRPSQELNRERALDLPATSWRISNRDLMIRLEKDLGRIRNLVAPSGRLS